MFWILLSQYNYVFVTNTHSFYFFFTWQALNNFCVCASTLVCSFFGTAAQGRNEVRWRPGQEAKFGAPCSNLRSFGSKCTVLKKVLVTFLKLFDAPAVMRRPHDDSAPGELFPLAPPSLHPCCRGGLRLQRLYVKNSSPGDSKFKGPIGVTAGARQAWQA